MFRFLQRRRSADRIRLSSRDVLEIHLLAPDGAEIPGRLLDVSSGGVGASFNSDDVDTLGLERHVRIDVQLSGSGVAVPEIRALCEVRRVKATGCNVYLGLCFCQPAMVHKQIPKSLWRYFERRKVPAMKLDGEDAVPVRIGWSGRVLEGRLCSVTIRGVGVLLDADSSVPESNSPARLTFRLPGSKREMVVDAKPRHRTPSERGLFCGFEFCDDVEAQLKLAEFHHRKALGE